MWHFVVVFLGGGFGAASRHGVNLWALRQFGPNFPVGTLMVNVIGSLAMGFFVGWLVKKGGGDASLRLAIATGFLGGFTTFSAFSLDVANLWERGVSSSLLLYIGGSVCLSIGAVFAGLAFARSFFS